MKDLLTAQLTNSFVPLTIPKTIVKNFFLGIDIYGNILDMYSFKAFFGGFSRKELKCNIKTIKTQLGKLFEKKSILTKLIAIKSNQMELSFEM